MGLSSQREWWVLGDACLRAVINVRFELDDVSMFSV